MINVVIRRKARTIGNAENSASVVEVVLELVVEESEKSDQEMKENENREEQLPPTLVDHPQTELFAPVLGYVRVAAGGAGMGQRALEALEAASLRFIALKMAGLSTIVFGHIWMLVDVIARIVREVETRRVFWVHGHHGIKYNERWTSSVPRLTNE